MEWNAVRELNGSVIKLHQKSVLQNELVNQSGSLHPIPTLNSATWAVLQPISQNITVMSGFTSLHQYKRNDWKILLTDVVKAKKKKKNTWHCNLWEQKVLQGISASLSWRSHTLLGNLTGSNLTIFYRMSLEGDGERQWISMSSISGWKPIIHPFNWYRLYTFLFVTIRGKWKLDEK